MKDAIISQRSQDSTREAFTGLHIRTAYHNFPAGHPIRQLLLNASLRPYFEFRYNALDNRHAEDLDNSNLDAAKRKAYGTKRFFLHKELSELPDFRLEFSDARDQMSWGREVLEDIYGYKKSPSKSGTRLMDPLNGGIFSI